MAGYSQRKQRAQNCGTCIGNMVHCSVALECWRFVFHSDSTEPEMTHNNLRLPTHLRRRAERLEHVSLAYCSCVCRARVSRIVGIVRLL